MKRIVMCLMLGSWAVAIAQAPPGEEPTDGTDAGEQALPCVPASETSPLEGEQEDAGPGPVPCEELDPEVVPGEELDPEVASGEELDPAEASGEFVADPEAIAEEDSETEASAEEEFKPGDEISEDYAVPLPSDI